MILTDWVSILENINMSFAKQKWVSFILQHLQWNRNVRLLVPDYIKLEKTTITRINSSGDRGSPWRRPLETKKKPTNSPLREMEKRVCLCEGWTVSVNSALNSIDRNSKTGTVERKKKHKNLRGSAFCLRPREKEILFLLVFLSREKTPSNRCGAYLTLQRGDELTPNR